MRRGDALPLALVLLAPALLLAPVLFTDRVFFYQDITNITFAWRNMAADQLARGQVPLWNPYAGFGLPLLGNFQSGVFFPLSTLFYFFPFTHAVGVFLLACYWIGGGGAYLWLRKLGLRPLASLGGALAFTLSGFLVSQMQFPNLLGTLVFLPVVFLFSEAPLLLALASALSFHSGYLPIWAFLLGALFALRWLWPRRDGLARTYAGMAAGAGVSLLLCAAVLGPGVELIRKSARSTGIPVGERTELSYTFDDFTTLLHPEAARALARRRFGSHPGVERMVWEHEGKTTTFSFTTEYVDPVEDQSGAKFANWKSGYLGVAAWSTALLGLAALAAASRLKAAAVLVWAAGVMLLLLGTNTRVSGWLWEHVFVLKLIRGPARLSWLLLPVAVPLVALGLEALRRLAGRRGNWLAAAVAGAIGVELVGLGAGFYPTARKDYFVRPGALVTKLRQELGGHRFLKVAPSEVQGYLNKADRSAEYLQFRETAFKTYREKLHGISNAPFRIQTVAADFEPLVPRKSYETILEMRLAAPQDRARLMRWTDVGVAGDRKPTKAEGLEDLGAALWHLSKTKDGDLSRAYRFPADWESRLKGRLTDMPKAAPAAAWDFQRPREDRARVRGSAAEEGVLYLAEPFYPGWHAYVNGKAARLERALDAFVMLRVPAGDVVVDLVFRPRSWRTGAWTTAAALVLLAGFCLARAARWRPE